MTPLQVSGQSMPPKPTPQNVWYSSPRSVNQPPPAALSSKTSPGRAVHAQQAVHAGVRPSARRECTIGVKLLLQANKLCQSLRSALIKTSRRNSAREILPPPPTNDASFFPEFPGSENCHSRGGVEPTTNNDKYKRQQKATTLFT